MSEAGGARSLTYAGEGMLGESQASPLWRARVKLALLCRVRGKNIRATLYAPSFDVIMHILLRR